MKIIEKSEWMESTVGPIESDLGEYYGEIWFIEPNKRSLEEWSNGTKMGRKNVKRGNIRL